MKQITIEELRLKLKDFKGITLIHLSVYLGNSEFQTSYSTIKGWSSKRPELYKECLHRIAYNLGEHISETDKSKVYSNLLSKIVEKDLQLSNETNLNVSVDSPLKKIGWVSEVKEIDNEENK